MAAGKHNFIIEVGATFRSQLTYKDSLGAAIDLTGYTARMQIRESQSSNVVIQDLTTANAGIVLGGALGTIDLFISDADTDLMTLKSGVYDLEIVNTAGNGDVVRLIEGNIAISKSVTR